MRKVINKSVWCAFAIWNNVSNTCIIITFIGPTYEWQKLLNGWKNTLMQWGKQIEPDS